MGAMGFCLAENRAQGRSYLQPACILPALRDQTSRFNLSGKGFPALHRESPCPPTVSEVVPYQSFHHGSLVTGPLFLTIWLLGKFLSSTRLASSRRSSRPIVS